MPDDVKPWEISDAQAEFTPAQRTVAVCFDGTLATRIDDLEAELENADGPTAGAIAQELAALHDQVKAKARPFVIQAIGNAWRDLLNEHPPAADQLRIGLAFDPATFPIAAIAACCVVPVIDEAQSRWLFEHLAVGQWRRIWQACLDLNMVGEDAVGKSLSSTARLLLSVRSSTTASPEESPGASSLESGS